MQTAMVVSGSRVNADNQFYQHQNITALSPTRNVTMADHLYVLSQNYTPMWNRATVEAVRSSPILLRFHKGLSPEPQWGETAESYSQNTMKAYRGVEVELHIFLASAVYESELSASRSSYFYPKAKAPKRVEVTISF